jgi:hypothetical protein
MKRRNVSDVSAVIGNGRPYTNQIAKLLPRSGKLVACLIINPNTTRLESNLRLIYRIKPSEPVAQTAPF